MLYPPPEYLVEENPENIVIQNSSDSTGGVNITIINENVLSNDRYYQDPRYLRYGWFGDYGYWDPYYYDPYSYYDHHRWHRGGYYPHDRSPGRSIPKPKKPRRTANYRRTPYSTDESMDANEPDNSKNEDVKEKPTSKQKHNSTQSTEPKREVRKVKPDNSNQVKKEPAKKQDDNKKDSKKVRSVRKAQSDNDGKIKDKPAKKQDDDKKEKAKSHRESERKK